MVTVFLECSKSDKAIFINNLVRIFKTEYNRDQYAALLNGNVIKNIIPIILYIYIFVDV